MACVRKLWLLIGLLVLTNLQGQPIWIVASQIVAVRSPVDGECGKCANAVVVTLNGNFSVRENAADVASKLENMK